ncbi:beta-galactosidase [Leifsonia naganoensis]|uniref:Glycoside hydrolase 35 catalytic domain-containing protein n=1 Tax=Leifsonia naganoensis TaxID=150025 RepID=A0A853DLZ1_9MICO|nr:beta-galactosidase [Leifsonia naganoensis]NYK09287.1 hypothetical protein [Leifsonia naganoensis]
MTPFSSATAASPALVFDATGAGLAPTAARTEARGAVAPDGRVLGATNFHLTLDGEPLPLVSGELILQRYPVDEWPEAVRALRDGGCSVVSSYVFWGQVEPRAGEFDFTGSNDVRRFAQVCADEGMLFAPRVGPFNNSEFLLGGLPPWLYGMPLTERSDDPRYLARVGRYFERLAEELRGLYWSDGGPIVVVQLENELTHAPNDWRTLFGYTATDHRGPGAADFDAHMASLRGLAIDAGILPPYFSMTAWGLPGDLPTEGYLPSYGAYMDLHPNTGGNHTLTTFVPGDYPTRGVDPILFSELGTGSPARAAYRAMTPPESMLTTAVTRLASIESIFLGYYLFHGGTNPVRGDGFGWTTKEPAFPQRSYDFWAPVSEFGERRESFHLALPFNRFVQEFGADLARTEVVQPADPVVDPDEDRLRAVLRADGSRGFVFLVNHGDIHPLSERAGVTVTVATDAGTVAFPRRAELTVASSAALVLPIGLDLGAGLTLATATAQPLARLGSAVTPVVAFHAPAGSVAEFAFTGIGVEAVEAGTGVEVFDDPDGATVLVTVDAARSFRIAGPGGTVELITLPTDQAEHSAIVATPAGRQLVSSDAELSTRGTTVELSLLRPLGEGDGTAAVLRRHTSGTDLVVDLPAPAIAVDAIAVEQLAPGRALLTLRDPAADVDGLWLDIAYSGDLCRLFDAATGLLVADDFSRGIPWRIRLGRFADALRADGLQLRVEPLSERVEVPDDEGILLDHAEQPQGDATIDGLAFAERVTTVVDLGA